jgi:predicted nucleotidyltransferase
MKQHELLAYVYDYVRFLVDRSGSADIDEIMLFGSVARGDWDATSDADLFVNTKKVEDVQKVVDAALNEFEGSAMRNWELRGIKLPIKCIVGDIKSPRWAALKRDIISSSIMLFGRYRELPEGLQHNVVFSFSLAKLRPKNKVRFLRQLYGYSSKKVRKVYIHKGMLRDIDGAKLNPSTIAVPIASYQKMLSFFRKNQVPCRVREAWM